MAKHRRGRSNESPAADQLPLSLGDVYLLTAESNGQLAINGLTLVIDPEGLTVLAPGGTTAAVLAWAELTALRTVGRTTAPGGEDAVLLEVSSQVRRHRFVVPTDDPVALEATVAFLAGVPTADRPHRARRRR